MLTAEPLDPGAVPRRLRQVRGDAATVTAYLSGSIRKGRGDDRPAGTFWSEADEEALVRGAGSVRVTRLNPARTPLRRQDYLANYGADLHLVSSSDVVVVDARTEKGIGVGAEMMFACQVGVPVVTVCPPNTNYRRDLVEDVFGEDLRDWIHPFVAGLSDYIVDDFAAAGALVAQAAYGNLHKRCPEASSAIEYYLEARRRWASPSGV